MRVNKYDCIRREIKQRLKLDFALSLLFFSLLVLGDIVEVNDDGSHTRLSQLIGKGALDPALGTILLLKAILDGRHF